MREAAFIKQNQDKWEAFEKVMGRSAPDPDELVTLFVQITDDLAFAQTQYPESRTTVYLNNLASKVHQTIYRNKRERSDRILNFWRFELPKVAYQCRREILISFTVFLMAAGIGVLSAANDDTFVRLILGDSYINMTLENINNDDPMAVYKQMRESDMFAVITLNNIYVSFMVFISGALATVGTIFHLFRNAVMLGAFQYFFYQEGLFMTSFLTIWIHGTFEISAIIIAGGAGIVMGNSILFPQTFTRLESFRQGVKKGVKLVIGLVPIFIVAGFLEGFATRHTEWSIPVKASIIIGSGFIILYYFFIYPYRLYGRRQDQEQGD